MLIGMIKSKVDADEWDAIKANDVKLCIIGSWTHVGYNLLSSILDRSIFHEHFDIDIYLYDL